MGAGRIRFPLSPRDLLLAKLTTLFHDPPWKSITITRHHILPDYLVEIICNTAKVFASNNDASSHEREAACLYYHVMKTLGLTNYLSSITPTAGRRSERHIRLIVHRADVVASSFDRIAAAEAGLYRKKYCSRSLRTAVVHGLFNIFRAGCSCAAPVSPAGKLKTEACELLTGLVYNYISRLDIFGRSGRSDYSLLVNVYNVLLPILEPAWYLALHKASREAGIRGFISPADTRVPHHSIFDHLYASAAAANLVIPRKPGEGSESKYAVYSGETRFSGLLGLLVYVGLRGVGWWIGSSRKLSDVWVSSWLATALVCC